MNRSTLHKLLLARRLLDLGRQNLSSANDLSLAIGVNLLQDAVEAFLLAVSEHVNAEIRPKTTFDGYFDLIDLKIAPASLPFRTRLLALNKLRVNSKHYGLVPARSETGGLLVTVREFFDEVAKSVFGLSFVNVSLLDMLMDGEAKTLLQEAEAAYMRGEFDLCLILCRKALFVRIESHYSIASFATGQTYSPVALALMQRKAPYYCRTPAFIDEYVKEPTDFIVFDHNELEMDLMKSGMDRVSFWNVWRLTPAVYRAQQDSEWIVKRDFAKLEKDGIQDRAEYVLDTTINLFISADQRIAASRAPDHRRYFINLRRELAPIYKKADSTSELVANTPIGLKQLYVDYAVPALDGVGEYWHVVHSDEPVFLWGFISDDEVIH